MKASAREAETVAGKPRRSAFATLAAGTIVDQYELRRSIATGGFGTVYEAIDRENGKAAALKVLHPEHMDAQSIVRFRREIEILDKLRHPNVVRIEQVGTVRDGRPYFAMEYLDGQDLGARLRERKRLTITEALDIVRPLCDALSLAHANQIVHRDIKPSNVFLAHHGDDERVVLLDFGVAKLCQQDADSITRSNQFVGTPAAMAPEQVLGGEVTARTDVYTTASLVYAMLSGKLPFGRLSFEQKRSVSMSTPAPLSRYVNVPQPLDAAISRAMRPDPADRFPSIMELMRAIEDAVAAPAKPSDAERALLIEVRLAVASALLAEPDDALLDELDAAADEVLATATGLGMSLVRHVGQNLLLRLPVPPGPQEIEDRARCVAGALAMHRSYCARNERDERVRMQISMRIADAPGTRASAVGAHLQGRDFVAAHADVVKDVAVDDAIELLD